MNINICFVIEVMKDMSKTKYTLFDLTLRRTYSESLIAPATQTLNLEVVYSKPTVEKIVLFLSARMT